MHELGAELAEQMAKMTKISDYDEFVKEASLLLEKGKDIKHLKEKYKDVIKKHHDTNIALDKMLEDVIEIELEKFPIEKVPINITGSFLNSIKSMLLC